MGFFDMLLGNEAADAAKAAAGDTYNKQQAATKGITDYGDTYASNYANLAKAYDPYVQTGATANTALQRLMADPYSVSYLPGYQFGLDQGVKALQNSAAGRGMLNSGAAGKDVMKYATGYADQNYGNQFARLMGLSGQGVGATGAQVNTVGQGLQGQLATRQSAYGGNMNSAGTIGQGDVAAANAKSQGIQNLMNMGVTLAAAAMGMPSPTMFGGGGSSSYMSNPMGMGGYGGAKVGYDKSGNFFNYG